MNRFSKNSSRVLKRPYVCKSTPAVDTTPPPTPINVRIQINVSHTDGPNPVNYFQNNYHSGVRVGQRLRDDGFDDRGNPVIVISYIERATSPCQITIYGKDSYQQNSIVTSSTPGWKGATPETNSSTIFDPGQWIGDWSWEVL